MNNLEFEYTITATRAYCPKCDSEYINKAGRTEDNRQIIKCLDCGKKSTLGARRKGEQAFNRYKLLPIHLKDPLDLTPEELYSMGVLIADGSLSKTNQLSITLKPDDVEVLNIVKQSLQIKNPIKTAKCSYIHKRTKEKLSGIYSRLTWGYKFAPAYWNTLGLYADKTGNEIWLPYMANHHFLRGLWDGDGGFGFTNEKVLRAFYSCACYEFTESIRDFIYEQIQQDSWSSFSNGAYNLHFYNKAAILLGDFIYQDSEGLRLERKYQKYLEIKNRHN